MCGPSSTFSMSRHSERKTEPVPGPKVAVGFLLILAVLLGEVGPLVRQSDASVSAPQSVRHRKAAACVIPTPTVVRA